MDIESFTKIDCHIVPLEKILLIYITSVNLDKFI